MTLWSGQRLGRLQNRLKKIFGPKRNEIIRDWIKLHNKELHSLYFSPNIIRMITSRKRWAGKVACIGIR
jgi:hypothetical protein